MANLSWISSNPDYINQMIRNTQVTLSNNYNDLDNIPIIKIISTTNNPQKIWELEEGLYIINGVIQVDNSTSYEVSNLLVSMTARLENGKYILSAFIPYLRGLFEYILKTNSTEYEQHQKIVLTTKNDTLALDNETIYTPTEDYHPTTKKYVDDKVNEVITELDRMGVNKENLESLNKENRIRNIKLQALLSETSDRNITIEENVRYFDMPLSIDNGIVTINEMIGDTLVNVCDQEESVAITKSYTVENENHIPLQGEYDGKCRPVLHGNTLVNHNADWDDTLQTGVVTSAEGTEDVEIEGTRGQEVSVVVEGNTVLNHALGKASAVVNSIEDNLVDSYFTPYNNKFPSLNEIATLDGANNDAYTPTGRIKILQNNTNLVYGEMYTLIVDILSLPENTKLHWYIMFTDDTYQYSGTVNAASVVGKYIKNITIVEANKEKTFKRFALYIPSLVEGIATIQNPILLKGDHTTNPKYVNSNNGNYVDLTVANDMSSVVEIEGRTMVNVCDQKDPIAITKSYTVENSGNHIALQGEYDGKCRPVIQGNTMVNLAPISYNRLNANLSDEVTLNSLNSDPATLTGRIKEFTPIVDLRYGTLYTITFDVISITEGIMVHGYIAYDEGETQYSIINADSVGKYSVRFTLSQDADVTGFGLYVNSSNATENIAVIKNVMLFEGDLTQTPELIPTEYVEGLKSSFEDNLVTQEMVDSGEESAENLGKYKVEYKVTGKNKFDKVRFVEFNKDLDWKCDIVTYNNEECVAIQQQGHQKVDILNSLNLNRKKTYTLSSKYFFEKSDEKAVLGIRAKYTDGTQETLYMQDTEGSFIFNTKEGLEIEEMFIGEWQYSGKIYLYDFQLEEGTTLTEYEPYKEYTKTFYLNSPLLEGDTIEDVNGVATHVKRYGKVVLDGSEYWELRGNYIPFCVTKVTLKPNGNISSMSGARCDKLNVTNITSNSMTDNNKGIYIVGSGDYTHIRIRITNEDTRSSIKQWLQANPTTVVYQLASPIYEPISTESILCDSYVNGHLDFDTNVPIEKVEFQHTPQISLKYIQPNTGYTLQFVSDSIGKVNNAYIGWSPSVSFDVSKGVNKIILNATDSASNHIKINGIGFNASNIVVTEATDADFDYFEGLKSSYEYEVTEDGKYKVDVKVTGKNLFDGELTKGFLNETGEEVMTDGGLYWRSNFIKVNGSNITFSHECNPPGFSSIRVFLYDSNFNKIEATPVTYSYTFTLSISTNVKYVRFYYEMKSALTSTSEVLISVQLEEGTEATSYEPYFESTKTFYLNSPLLEGDKIVTKNGKLYHYHKMGKVVLDGSEDWTLNVNDTNTIWFYSNKIIESNLLGSVFCNTLYSTLEIQNDNETILQSEDKRIHIRINKSKLSTPDVSGFKQWLQANPTTVIYELASPYYELIDEYNNTILNIPKNVAHLTHTSAVPVNNTVFTNYKDELNVLEANTQYRVMFDCDKANISFTVTLGGTSQTVISKIGTHSLLITTPSELVDKNLVIDGIGRCGIDNIRIFKGNVEYDYVKGLWSGYEERKLVNLCPNSPNSVWGISEAGYTAWLYGDDSYNKLNFKPNTYYTVILENTPNNFKSFQCYKLRFESYYECNNTIDLIKTRSDLEKSMGLYVYSDGTPFTLEDLQKIKIIMLEGDWTDNPPTYEEVMANEGKYAVKVKLDTNANIFGKGGRL